MRTPSHNLPSGASRWDLVNDVAILTGKQVRTIISWCEKGLFHCLRLAGGYGGIWVAVDAHGWPLDGPRVEAYRETRRAAARVAGRIGSPLGVAAREARRAPKKSRSKSNPRRSA